jgi:undecaprenyl-phosphate 4-deoxy-4-formamido-L-arabinose transferase
MAVLLVIGGLLMLLIGVLGEYVGRIYISLNNLPQFLIREVKSGKEQKGGRQ